MTRINTNISSIQAMNRLNTNNNELSLHLNRLSSGLRINAGKDDPAGLIASENLRSEMAGINQAIDNSTRAGSVISTAEGALNEVSSLLLSLKGLINGSANKGGMSSEEVAANQMQINSAVESINRIANSTAFEGSKLLNGSMDFNVTSANTAKIKDLQINQVRFGTAASVPVTVTVNTAATQGNVHFVGSSITTDVTLRITGAKGVEVFSFASGAKISSITAVINQNTDVTGITAKVSAVSGAASGINFKATDFGSKQFVKVEALAGSFNVNATGGASANNTQTAGTDATVVVNGIVAVSDGLKIQVNGPSVYFNATLDATLNVAAGSTTFSVTGGGAQFQLGPTVNSQQQAIIGIGSVAAHSLGTAINGYLRDITSSGSKNVQAGKSAEADRIVNDAISQVATMRGRLGAFQKNTLATNISSLNVALENITASESAIRDADFAKETAAMTRSQILVKAGTSVLAVANSAPQNVLALLG